MRAARSAWGVTMVNMLFPAGPLVLYVALPSVVLQGCTPASDAEEGDGSTCKDRDKCASYEWVLCEFSHIQEECPQKCRNCSDTADHDVPLMGDCGKNGPYCAVPSASCVVKGYNRCHKKKPCYLSNVPLLARGTSPVCVPIYRQMKAESLSFISPTTRPS
eukprot:GEMP01106626.1.p1 GENE.GEMP01106626.1~~GEMP01106626.1.p1  ORF type:complete len:161 (+),score=17.09 GEMP01106626.1:195-677(+)